MLQSMRAAIAALLGLTVVTGGLYPLVVTAVARWVFPHQSSGSLLTLGDRPAGSEWIGQPFSKPEYFWGRLSATSPLPYNAAASSGSNFGPLHPGLREAAQGRLRALGVGKQPVPVDLVTASASGLDPHISPAAAEVQVPRVAAARRMDEEAVRAVVRQHTEGRQWGILGEPRVHVLRVNLALDQLPPRR